MRVTGRDLYRLILIGLAISTPGFLIDADHWYAVVMGWENGRWLHYTLASTPVVLILLSMLWGLVATAFTVGWVAHEPAALEVPAIELPQLAPPVRVSDAPPHDD